MSEFVKEITDSNFETEVLNSSLPTLVDFWAPWCAPCRMIAPMVEQVAKENSSVAQVGKMNVDENPNVSQRYGIKGIPTLILFKDGREVERMVGAGTFEALSRLVDRHTAKAA